MAVYDKSLLGRQAAKLGFIRDTYEKALRLTDVLSFINSDPLLKDTLALKGGTAINALTVRKIRTDLQPVLRKRDWFDLTVAQQRVSEYLVELINLAPAEEEFLVAFRARAWRPELLFSDEELERVRRHPMAIWKLGDSIYGNH
ncbi:MAG: hypothetical protein LBI84_10045 [Propionibacteriaceae bacterium]|jgi:hypothetical protein|nr:hypothetical protein [Propionibacteriaceae bacterium]